MIILICAVVSLVCSIIILICTFIEKTSKKSKSFSELINECSNRLKK